MTLDAVASRHRNAHHARPDQEQAEDGTPATLNPVLPLRGAPLQGVDAATATTAVGIESTRSGAVVACCAGGGAGGGARRLLGQLQPAGRRPLRFHGIRLFAITGMSRRRRRTEGSMLRRQAEVLRGGGVARNLLPHAPRNFLHVRLDQELAWFRCIIMKRKIDV